jgi:hypothetical protein
VTTGAGTTVTGGYRGIVAKNAGSGALSVTVNGDVGDVATTNDGIYARNANETNVSVTTGAGTTVTGGRYGILALNYGSGALSVTANGDVKSANADGIFAQNSGTAVTVTTGAGTTVTGDDFGIRAFNNGGGALTVVANGDVKGTNNDGIFARNTGGGAMTITAKGDVTGGGDSDGIYAYNLSAPVTINVGSASHVTSHDTTANDFAIDIMEGSGDVTGGLAARFRSTSVAPVLDSSCSPAPSSTGLSWPDCPVTIVSCSAAKVKRVQKRAPRLHLSPAGMVRGKQSVPRPPPHPNPLPAGEREEFAASPQFT